MGHGAWDLFAFEDLNVDLDLNDRGEEDSLFRGGALLWHVGTEHQHNGVTNDTA